MIIHRHVDPLPAEARRGVVAVGNFDGVHFGHQAVIGEAVRRARAERAPASVLTFEPHPRRFFQPGAPPFLLTRFRTKARIIAGLGIDHLFVLRFDAVRARQTAEDFIDQVLIGGLHARHVVIGYDFVFGRGRAGNAGLLSTRLGAHGIGVTAVPPVMSLTDPVSVSSTSVRNALSAGDPRAAATLLGRPFEIEARVMRGDARGRTIGFPTANLWLGDCLRPALGVYAVRVAVAEPRARAGRTLTETAGWLDGVANLGLRPTFGGLTEPRLEVHLFDYGGDLYGRRLRVALIEFLRPERKFDGIDALKMQIARDAEAARNVLEAG